LELLFRCGLRFLRPAELTHAGRPQAEDPPIGKHTTPAPLLCETVHGAGPNALHHRDAIPWSHSEHFRCCPRTCRPLRDTLGGGEPTVQPWTWRKAGGARPDVRHETTRVHHAARRRGGGMAGRVIGRARMSLVLPAGNVTSPRSSRPLTARALRCCFRLRRRSD